MSVGPTEQLERARQVIAALRKRLAEAQAAGAEPTAIIGMACRFPGEARDCDGYWRMVVAGRDAVRPIPPPRARDMAATNLRPAALLEDIETFDAGFFDISPREAVQMDPQQRLFLEVAWEALEDAGQTRSALAGSPTGVFVGVHNHSGGYLELQTAELSRLNEYSAVGSGHDVIAGRLAYVLDLRGPSMVVNTACSSSLVAVHLACQSLAARDSRTAVVGGVNLILGPMQSRIVGLGAMLAEDGRCKTFDERADGYGRGEGCGVIVLKRLSDARADRDRILAVIRASAINQDGRTNGLTAPNGLSQQSLLRRTLASAGIEAARVGYVEAHGTGTALGDPIEVEAIASVYGASAEGAPRCALGSAKANINHLEGAAGIAGVIRTILILRNKTIPPVAGLKTLNPHLSLDGTRLFIPTEAVPWHAETPRVAAVSAFGWSGVNAHLLLEEAPAAPRRHTPRATPLLVSAPDAATLSELAASLAAALQKLPDAMLESFAWTATARRSHYDFRLAVVAGSCTEMAQALRSAAREPRLAPRQAPPRIGFVVGDDSVSAAVVGSDLMAEEETFRNIAASCAAAFEVIGAKEIAASLASRSGFSAVPENVRLFVCAVGVAALFERWGVQPDMVAGWGAGAVAAEYLGAKVDLAQAARQLLRGERDGRSPGSEAARLAHAGIDYVVRLDQLESHGDETAARGSARRRSMQILAALAAAGAELAWSEIFASDAQLVSLPAYPFRRRRHWIIEAPAAEIVSRPPMPAADVPDDLFFKTVWQPMERPVAGGDKVRVARWLILGDENGPAAKLAALMRSRNCVALNRSDDAGESIKLLDMSDGRWIVVDLRALHDCGEPIQNEALRFSRQILDLVGALAQGPTAPDAKIWLVTQGAQRVTAEERANLAAAPLWGLARSLLLDRPEAWGSLIDLDPAAPFDPVQLYDEIVASCGDPDEIAFRNGQRYANRLLPAAVPALDTLRIDPAATYLITGAFGGVGPALALWLAQRGARSLVLTSRSLDESAKRECATAHLMRTLREMGVAVQIERCDVGDEVAVAVLFEKIQRFEAPLRGIFHLAAAATEVVDEIGCSDLVAAFRPKVEGALHVDAQSRAFALDCFVLFSSAAGVLGARGQGHYAAANAFLDALAGSRRAEGLPGLSIAWGLWGRSDAARVEYYKRVGLNPMESAIALAAMARLMSEQASGQQEGSRIVALLGERLRAAVELRGRRRFLSAVALRRTVQHSAESHALAEALRNAPAAARKAKIADLIAEDVRAVMELAAEDELKFERGFFDLGMDSLMTVALKARLENRFGMSLPSTVTIDYPSVAALSGYFEAQLLQVGSEAVDGVSVALSRSAPASASAVEDLNDDEVSDALAAELRALNLEATE
jgi:acyl transferase domain-containing protein